MTGMRTGETRTFPVTMPEDHPVEEWRGMQCVATITLRKLLSWVLPEVSECGGAIAPLS